MEISKLRLLGFGYLSLVAHALGFAYLDKIAQLPEKWLFCNLPSSKELRVELNPKSTQEKDEARAQSNPSFGQKNEENNPNALAQEKSQGEAQEPNFGEEWQDLRERLKQSENLRSRFLEHFDGLLPERDVPPSYIYRKRDYEDIIVKDVFPTLDTIDIPFQDIVKRAPEDLQRHKKRNELIEDYRLWKAGELEVDRKKVEIIHEEEGKLEVLHFPKSERQKYLDETLTLPKEEQLSLFIRRFSHYDPDRGDLPYAFRDLYYENLQRLAYIFSADHSYFTLDYYQENLNKEDYLKNSLALLSRYQASKTAAEILFTLENIYEIQQRAWYNFFEFQKAAPYITPQQRKQIRIETLLRVMHRYTPLARQKGISSYKDAVELYTQKRLEIMDYGLSTIRENYRRHDMLFEKGRIYWERFRLLKDHQSLENAIKNWQSLRYEPSTGDFLNKETYEKLQPYLTLSTRDYYTYAGMEIQAILDQRLEKVLSQKRDREYRLLWK
ncbi:MAG: hypothetical protein NZM25_01075 [Leptospiraceae bacterium]|nr:hypothetical protein [Leptospiraceae bacterium]MDW8306316.1 hypothetical protein [Leptospiraceae bacterium]